MRAAVSPVRGGRRSRGATAGFPTDRRIPTGGRAADKEGPARGRAGPGWGGSHGRTAPTLGGGRATPPRGPRPTPSPRRHSPGGTVRGGVRQGRAARPTRII